MAKEQLSDLDMVDDLYFSAIFMDESDEEQDQHMETDDFFQVSDAKYAAGLQFQEALMVSVLIYQPKNTATNKNNNSPSSEWIPEPSAMPNSKIETGQSSQIFCEICLERKETDQMFSTESCGNLTHSFCSDCISKHVASKIQESNNTVVTCPGINCGAVLELDICRTKLSKQTIDIWDDKLCQETISERQKFYCPFKNCSALLVNDNERGEVIRKSECPFCHRLFCAQCQVPWHSGVECEAFQRLNEDERGKEDLMVRQLAEEKKWSRCPRCRFYVERTEGCPHMVCRCNFEFCYGCGSAWSGNHSGCFRN